MATLTAPYISHSFRSTKQFSRILHRSSIQSVLNYRLNDSINSLTSTRNMSATKAEAKKCLHISNINPCIKTMEYAVRYVFKDQTTQKKVNGHNCANGFDKYLTEVHWLFVRL